PARAVTPPTMASSTSTDRSAARGRDRPSPGAAYEATPTQSDSYRPEHALESQPADPVFWLTTYPIAANQLTSGIRVLARIVPAVSNVSRRHAVQRRRPSPIRQYPRRPSRRTGTQTHRRTATAPGSADKSRRLET